MRRFVLLVMLTFIFAVGTGCVRPPAQEVATADYGPYPDNYQEIVKNHLNTILKDPYSARITFDGSPSPKFLSGLFRKTTYGWGGIVTVNAKNSFGAYVGATRFAYIINRGKIVAFDDNFHQ